MMRKIEIESIDAAEFLDLRGHRPMLIEDCVEDGQMVGVIGRNDDERNYLLAQIAVCIATGTPFLGARCRRRKVLFCSSSKGERYLRKALSGVCDGLRVDGGMLQNQLYVCVPEGYARLTNKTFDFVVEECNRLGCETLVVDNLRYLVWYDALDVKDVHAKLDPVRACIKRRRISLFAGFAIAPDIDEFGLGYEFPWSHFHGFDGPRNLEDDITCIPDVLAGIRELDGTLRVGFYGPRWQLFDFCGWVDGTLYSGVELEARKRARLCDMWRGAAPNLPNPFIDNFKAVDLCDIVAKHYPDPDYPWSEDRLKDALHKAIVEAQKRTASRKNEGTAQC